MRILYLVQKPQRRGAEIFALQLATALGRRGCDVRLAYLYPYDGEAALRLREQDTCLGGRESHPAEKLLGFRPQLLRRVTQAIAEFEPDVVQANGSRSLKYGALARRRARPGSWVLVYRNIAEPDRWLGSRRHATFYRRVVMPEVDGIVGVSDVTLANLRGMYDIRVPTVRIPRGVDMGALRPARGREEVRAELGVPVDAPVAVFVGSLAPEKRPDRLLRVFHAIRTQLPTARLWILGDGPLRAEVARQIGECGAQGSVDLLGVQEHVADFLAASDVLLLTSDTEGTPGVVLEAAATGLAVVATNVGGIPACVRDGQTAILTEPQDEGAFACAAISLLGDSSARARLGRTAQAWVAENFDLDVVASSYLEFYSGVRAKAGAGR